MSVVIVAGVDELSTDTLPLSRTLPTPPVVLLPMLMVPPVMVSTSEATEAAPSVKLRVSAPLNTALASPVPPVSVKVPMVSLAVVFMMKVPPSDIAELSAI